MVHAHRSLTLVLPVVLILVVSSPSTVTAGKIAGESFLSRVWSSCRVPGGSVGYREHKIPVDTSRVAGLASRRSRCLVPWLHAHAYRSDRVGLDHSTPEEIARMPKQLERFDADAWMWLGVDSVPCAWKKGTLLFVAARPDEGDTALPWWLWRVAGEPN